MTFAIVGTTEQIKEAFGLNRYDEHVKGWRWHLYVADDERRFQNVMAEVRRLRDMRRAETIQQLAAEAAE